MVYGPGDKIMPVFSGGNFYEDISIGFFEDFDAGKFDFGDGTGEIFGK